MVDLLSQLPVLIGFSLVLVLEPFVDGIHQFLFIERLHDKLRLTSEQRLVPVFDRMFIPLVV